MRAHAEWRRRSLAACLGVGLLGVAMTVAATAAAMSGGGAVRAGVTLLASFVGVLAPVVAAVIHAYGHKMAFAAHAQQYQRMAAIFSVGQKSVQALLDRSDLAGARSLLLELGCEALQESADWLIMHRERPLEVAPLW